LKTNSDRVGGLLDPAGEQASGHTFGMPWHRPSVTVCGCRAAQGLPPVDGGNDGRYFFQADRQEFGML